MKKLITLAIVLLLGCATEKVELEERGYFLASVTITEPSIEGKQPVPECQAITPNKIRYRLLNSVDQAFTRESGITINGNQVTATDPVTFPAGNYEVDEISLLRDNVITHTAPNEINDPDFRDFVTRPLPFNVTIAPDQTTTENVELLCYTLDPIDLGPNWQGDGTILDLITIYFFIPENPNYDPDLDNDLFCIDQVTLTVDGFRIVEWPIFEPGLNSIPAPAEFTNVLMVAYDENLNTLQNIQFSEYNPDGVLDENDIIIFNDNCQ